MLPSGGLITTPYVAHSARRIAHVRLGMGIANDG